MANNITSRQQLMELLQQQLGKNVDSNMSSRDAAFLAETSGAMTPANFIPDSGSGSMSWGKNGPREDYQDLLFSTGLGEATGKNTVGGVSNPLPVPKMNNNPRILEAKQKLDNEKIGLLGRGVNALKTGAMNALDMVPDSLYKAARFIGNGPTLGGLGALMPKTKSELMGNIQQSKVQGLDYSPKIQSGPKVNPSEEKVIYKYLDGGMSLEQIKQIIQKNDPVKYKTMFENDQEFLQRLQTKLASKGS